MTESSDFRNALDAFLALPYPDYPRMEELRDWNSFLLDLDGHIAGYATRVGNGSLDASEVPDVDALVLEVETLRRDLELVRPERSEDAELLNKYRVYTAALERVVRGLAALARRQGESPMP
ncbi:MULTISPECIES: hypothetical protein [unclassified Streptomyces]|uniref:hypothetical protein n=1 Tax=unclassified Streptomyces TaxID=2593676 RepID=UPI0021C68D0B|nr:hypothetical protein [Streptomyces sp. FIT100]UUN26657.1 hypothetical protein KK483_09710 [Streptomyces sp. FIT100]